MTKGVPRRTLRSIHFYNWAEWRSDFQGSDREDILEMMAAQHGGGWVEAGRIELRSYTNGDRQLKVPLKKRRERPSGWVWRDEVVEVEAEQ